MSKTHLEYVTEGWGTVENYVRNVWGDEACFSIVGKSILIHLDNPTPEMTMRRIADFATNQVKLLTSKCQLCKEMGELGGDEVYEGELVAAKKK